MEGKEIRLGVIGMGMGNMASTFTLVEKEPDLRFKKRRVLLGGAYFNSTHSLDDDVQTIRSAFHPLDDCECPDLLEVGQGGVFRGRVFLCQNHQRRKEF